MNGSSAAQLVLEIRRRHYGSSRHEVCVGCDCRFPCDAIRAADQIEALLAQRVGEAEGVRVEA